MPLSDAPLRVSIPDDRQQRNQLVRRRQHERILGQGRARRGPSVSILQPCGWESSRCLVGRGGVGHDAWQFNERPP